MESLKNNNISVSSKFRDYGDISIVSGSISRSIKCEDSEMLEKMIDKCLSYDDLLLLRTMVYTFGSSENIVYMNKKIANHDRCSHCGHKLNVEFLNVYETFNEKVVDILNIINEVMDANYKLECPTYL